MGILCLLLWVYAIALFGRVILSWFPISENTFMASVYGGIYAITEPVLGPVRRAIPPIGVGGMGLDLSATLVLVGYMLVVRTICG